MKILLAALILGTLLPHAVAGDRFVQLQKLPDGGAVVVAEGDREPRSTGSYSVRLYAAGQPEHPTDAFLQGLVRARDGAITHIAFQPLRGRHAAPELIVFIESPGSGGYLSADAYAVSGKRLRHLGSVSGLAPGTDPIARLRARLAK